MMVLDRGGLALLVVLVLVGGCLSPGAPDAAETSRDAPGTSTESPVETSHGGSSTETVSATRVTEPTETATDTAEEADAKDQALAAERAYVTRQLRNASCLDEWGFSAPVVDREASIVDRTDGSYTLEVQQPFWYSEGETHADTFSTATYVVDAEGAERTHGDPVSPCR